VNRATKHVNARYIIDRLKFEVDQRLKPADPWLTRDSILLIDQLLRPTDVGCEFGSGRSTRWFASRLSQLTSIEHNGVWHAQVSGQLADCANVDYHLRECDGIDDDGNHGMYIAPLETVQDGSIDFCLVDGVYRDWCALLSIAKLRSGGLLVVDNANWFLPPPYQTFSPGTVSAPNGPQWLQFSETVQGWRSLWTTNGVTDTALYFKP